MNICSFNPNVIQVNNIHFNSQKRKKINFATDSFALKQAVNVYSMQTYFNSVNGNPDLIKKKYLTSMNNGQIMAFSLNSDCLKELHKEIAQYPDLLYLLHTSKDELWGNLLLHRPPKNENESLVNIHETLEFYNPVLLRQLHLTKNKEGKLPAHCYAVDVDKLKELHRVFKDEPELLAKIHLTKDENGRLPIHSIVSLEALREIHRIFENKPEILSKLHMTRDSSFLRPIDYCSFEKIDEIKRILPDDIYAKVANNRVASFVQGIYEILSTPSHF